MTPITSPSSPVKLKENSLLDRVSATAYRPTLPNDQSGTMTQPTGITDLSHVETRMRHTPVKPRTFRAFCSAQRCHRSAGHLHRFNKSDMISHASPLL